MTTKQPSPEPGSVLDRLIASGRAKPARLNLADLGPPLEPILGVSLSETLAEMRSEER